jgi:hypothetical protein
VKRAAILILLSGLAGCGAELKPGAESIFEAFGGEISPGELAAMSIDPYDANNRYRGTLGLSYAYFANEPVYIALFEDNIDDPDPAVRMAATRGLSNHGEPRHVPLLLTALKDPSKMVRLEAARGLQRIHEPAAVSDLIVASREPVADRDRERRGLPPAPAEAEPDVRAEAADALGQYAELRVLHALVAALDDSDLAVNAAALRSLRTLTGQDFGVDRATWADWLSRTNAPFAGRQLYTYPTFKRDLRFYEYIPLVPKPINENPAPPAGLPRG